MHPKSLEDSPLGQAHGDANIQAMAARKLHPERLPNLGSPGTPLFEPDLGLADTVQAS